MAKVTDTFSDRQSTAAEARKALLEKFKTRPSSDSPEMQRKLAERKAINEAREKRAAERAEAQRILDEERAREQAALEAQRQAELEAAELAANADRLAREAASAERASRVISDEIDRKAKRDAKYAARKARKN